MSHSMCIPCSVEFDSEEAFQAHKASGHTVMDNGTPLVDPGIPASALPNQEFLEAVQRLEDKAKTPPGLEQVPGSALYKIVKPEPQPIILTYKYEGSCPDCQGPVTTLEMDVEGKHFVMAYCVADNKQLESREVAHLRPQDPPKTASHLPKVTYRSLPKNGQTGG